MVEEACATLAEHIREELAAPRGGVTWLPAERELASRLGVSRTVIREATKRLELQGLLEIHHGKGLKVVDDLHKPLSASLRLDIPEEMERLRQLSETRSMVEPEAARFAALRARPEDIEELRAIQERLEGAKDLVEAAEADVAFHQGIARAAGNAVVAMLLRSLAELNRESRMRTLGTTGVKRAWGHHGKILDAIESGDGDEAAQQMRYHVAEAGRDLEATTGAGGEA